MLDAMQHSAFLFFVVVSGHLFMLFPQKYVFIKGQCLADRFFFDFEEVFIVDYNEINWLK